MQNYTELTKEISKQLSELKKQIPEVMEGFGTMHDSANKDGALSYKTKELIAVALGIASRCEECIGLHLKALIKTGVTRAEVVEMLSVAIYMGGGPSLMYAAKALHAYDELSEISVTK